MLHPAACTSPSRRSCGQALLVDSWLGPSGGHLLPQVEVLLDPVL